MIQAKNDDKKGATGTAKLSHAAAQKANNMDYIKIASIIVPTTRKLQKKMKIFQEINQAILINCVEKCLQNARELFDEAEILKNNKKYPRAYTLYHLSIEEIGKIFIIFQYLVQDDYSEEKSKKFSKEFADHKTKIKTSRNSEKIMLALLKNEPSTEDFENLTYDKVTIERLNHFKNLSLYTFIDNKSVFKPSDIISLDDINLIKPNSELRLILSEELGRLLVKNIDKFIYQLKENSK